MAEAMQNTAKAMVTMNKAVNATSISKMMAEFERENAKTEMMQELMGDAIDDALQDGADNEEEEDKIVNQVLDEIGISMGEEIPDAANLGALQHNANTESPMKVQPTAVGGGDMGSPSTPSDAALTDLEARLNNLKR